MSNRKYRKDPDSTKMDFSVEWAPWLQDGDFITGSVWFIESVSGDASPLAPSVSPAVFTITKATIFVKDGTRGKTYTLTNTITTNDGLDPSQSIYVEVRNL